MLVVAPRWRGAATTSVTGGDRGGGRGYPLEVTAHRRRGGSIVGPFTHTRYHADLQIYYAHYAYACIYALHVHSLVL